MPTFEQVCAGVSIIHEPAGWLPCTVCGVVHLAQFMVDGLCRDCQRGTS